jgi:uncharacterized protein (TIGR03083 family)
MSHPTTKQELLQRIRERHADMEELLSALSPAQMREPALDEGWSVKDSLAHLAAWENLAMDSVAQYHRGETPQSWTEQFSVGDGTEEEQMHRLNAQWFEENKERPLDQVLDDFREAFMRAVETISSLSQAEIFDPNYFLARSGSPLLSLIAGDTYAHYEEHLGWIRARFT